MGGGSSKACSELEAESAEFKKAQRRMNEIAAPEGPFLVSPRGARDPTATPPSSPYPILHSRASSRARLREDTMEMQSLEDESLDEQSMSNDSPTPLDLQSLSAEDDFQYLSAEESKLQSQTSADYAAVMSEDNNQPAVVPTEAATPQPQPFAFASAPRPRSIVTNEEPMRVSPVTSPRVSQLSSRAVAAEGQSSTTARSAAAARSTTSSRAQTPPSATELRREEVAADYRTALSAQWDQAEAANSHFMVDPMPKQRTSPRGTQHTLETFGASAHAEAGSDLGKRSPRAVLPALPRQAAVELEARSFASSDTADGEDGVDVHRRRQLRVAAALENMQLEREVSELRQQLEREKVVKSSRDIWGCNQGMTRMVNEERRPMYGKPLPYLERMHQPPFEGRQQRHHNQSWQDACHRQQSPSREDQQFDSQSPRSVGWERREAEAKAAEDQVAQERAVSERKHAASTTHEAITRHDEVEATAGGPTGGRYATVEARLAPDAVGDAKAAAPGSVASKAAAPLAPLERASSPPSSRQVPARQRRRQRKLQQQQAARQQNATLHAQRQSQRHKEAEEEKECVRAQTGGGEEVCEKPWSQSMEVRGSEVEYLLRNPVRSAQEMSFTLAAAEAGLLFLDHLEAKAQELGVLRGTLSRWILPFAEEGQSVEGQRSFAREVMTSLPPAVKQKLSDKEVNYLVKGANSVRRLIRVKIADDNDLNQAKESLLITARFFKRVLGEASDLNTEPYELLKMRRG